MVKIPIGISFDQDILKIIDKNRGDISRSRYLTKLLVEKHDIKLLSTITKNNLDSPVPRSAVTVSSESKNQ